MREVTIFNYLEPKEQDSSSFYPLLEIGDIRMFMYTSDQDLYIVYVLQDRILRKQGKKLSIKELLISTSDYSTILDLIDEKIDIRRALDVDGAYRIGQIGNKIFEKKLVNSLEEIQEKIPDRGVKLNGDIFNSINTSLVRQRVKNRQEYFEKLIFDSKLYSNTYTETITVQADSTKKTNGEKYYSFDQEITRYI